MPLLRPGLIAAWLLLFIASVRELGASILLMGPKAKVITPAIVESWFSTSTELTAAMAAAADAGGGRRAGDACSRWPAAPSRPEASEREPGRRSRCATWSSATARSSRCAGVTFTVGAGEHLTLLGPSGCGKTTTLRAIAGLERPTSGEIRIGGSPVFSSSPSVNVPAERRGLSMVFQSYAIWPHMSVFDNVAYGLRVREAARRPR